jgi:hypothetical protein
MCHKLKTLVKVKSGELSLCKACNSYQLQFNNLFFELNTEEFDAFKNYVFNIELDYWEHKYACSKMKRKIPIPSLQKNLLLIFSRQEIKELKALLSLESHSEYPTIDINDIDYTLIIN